MIVASDSSELLVYGRTLNDASEKRKQQALMDDSYIGFSRGPSEF